MVGSRPTPVHSVDDGFLRKVRKPLIEKKRRDRMNRSIEQLKLMIADSLTENCVTAKLDKADILDLTVSHLQRMKKHQTSFAMATQVAAYNSGFKDCARETIQFLSATGVISPESLGNLNQHLRSIFEKKSTTVTKDTVTMTTVTEKCRPESAISPNLPTLPPQHYSTPVMGTSPSLQCVQQGRSTPVLGTSHHFLNSSNLGAKDSPYGSGSVVDSGLECEDYSVLDLSQTSLSVGQMFGGSGSGSSRSSPGSPSGYDSGLENIIKEEDPWRPW